MPLVKVDVVSAGAGIQCTTAPQPGTPTTPEAPDLLAHGSSEGVGVGVGVGVGAAVIVTDAMRVMLPAALVAVSV